MIKDHCIENNIIDEVEEKPIAETAEVLRLKLEFEREERRLAHEEAQRAHEAARELRLAEFEAREHELKMASLGPPLDRASVFDPARNIRLD